MGNYFLYSLECVKILKQLFASGSVIFGEYSSRLRLGEYFTDNHLAFGEKLLIIIIISIISTDEDPSLRIESSAIINLRGVPTKLNKYIYIYFNLRLKASSHGRCLML